MSEPSHVLYALLIEDDELQARTVAAALASAGFNATISTTGSHAIDRLTHKPYHLVLVDLYLPDIEGPELIKILRSTPNGQNTRIIAVTSSDDPTMISQAIQSGADEHYHKTLGLDTIQARFERVAQKLKSDANMQFRMTALENATKTNTELLHEVLKVQAANQQSLKVVEDFVSTADGLRRGLEAIRKIFNFLARFWYIWALPAAAVGFLKTGVWTLPKD